MQNVCAGNDYGIVIVEFSSSSTWRIRVGTRSVLDMPVVSAVIVVAATLFTYLVAIRLIVRDVVLSDERLRRRQQRVHVRRL